MMAGAEERPVTLRKRRGGWVTLSSFFLSQRRCGCVSVHVHSCLCASACGPEALFLLGY